MSRDWQEPPLCPDLQEKVAVLNYVTVSCFQEKLQDMIHGQPGCPQDPSSERQGSMTSQEGPGLVSTSSCLSGQKLPPALPCKRTIHFNGLSSSRETTKSKSAPCPTVNRL